MNKKLAEDNCIRRTQTGHKHRFNLLAQTPFIFLTLLKGKLKHFEFIKFENFERQFK